MLVWGKIAPLIIRLRLENELNNTPSAINIIGSSIQCFPCPGEDISVCVCLAILISLFDDEGTFDGGKFFSQNCITKLEMRKILDLQICSKCPAIKRNLQFNQ
ncbi:uncharacterized protein LOC133796136 isoform X2 [Humulus lupulus]|uniref:uncharacterized protein LOC133796136 isoform X2 n=1 Tax=Humulus lupulus TaxID=3486 RepID=UPI002B40EC6D|nr:uncharacterized protein LOC133796136 isoform X2 [Humulus lupulus]